MFALFEISLLLSMYRASRAATGRTIALLATLCLALAAPFLDDTSFGWVCRRSSGRLRRR
jgi:hypothetical protein